MRVPLIIAGQGVNIGRTYMLVGLIDLYPAELEMTGLPKNPYSYGHSLMSFSKGECEMRGPIMSVYRKDNFGVIDGNYRYIRYANVDEELYDRAADPNEWENLVDNPKFADVKTKLAAEIPTNTAAPIRVGRNASRIKKK